MWRDSLQTTRLSKCIWTRWKICIFRKHEHNMRPSDVLEIFAEQYEMRQKQLCTYCYTSFIITWFIATVLDTAPSSVIAPEMFEDKFTTYWSASSCFFWEFLYSAFKCQLFSNGEKGPPGKNKNKELQKRKAKETTSLSNMQLLQCNEHNCLYLHWQQKYKTISIVTPPGRGVEYCNRFVCLCVREHVSGNAGLIFAKFVGWGLVLLRQRSNILCTSGFMNDVTLAVVGHMAMRG